MIEATLEQVTNLADQLSPSDKQKLIEHLARAVQQEKPRPELPPSATVTKRPQSLRGDWQNCFPEDLDVDAILNEIRREWEDEWPEVFRQ